MPVASPLISHQSCDGQKCPQGSKSPLFENHWAASIYSFAFQLPCVLANESTGKIKRGGRKGRSSHCSPNCQGRVGGLVLQRSQLLPGCPLHTALPFSSTGSASLAHLSTTRISSCSFRPSGCSSVPVTIETLHHDSCVS